MTKTTMDDLSEEYAGLMTIINILILTLTETPNPQKENFIYNFNFAAEELKNKVPFLYETLKLVARNLEQKTKKPTSKAQVYQFPDHRKDTEPW